MKTTFVMYVNVGHMHPSDVDEYSRKILNNFKELETDNSTLFLVPTRTGENKIECINPVYITNDELVKKHEEAIKNLTKKLNEI